MRRRFIYLLSAFLFPVTSFSADWQSPIARDHPLAGKIWAPVTRTFAAPDKVAAEAAKAVYVLLGEKHDNRDHHLLQAAILGRVIQSGRRPAVVFEMIGEDRQADIAKWRRTKPADAGGLGAALDWAGSGWPPWADYRPIAEAALKAELPIRAGNLPGRLAREISRKGLGVIDPARKVRLGLGQPVPDREGAAIRQTLFEAHCRLMPKSAMAPLVAVQRVRDAFLADNLIAAAGQPGISGALLIAGNGHARKDFGVPRHLLGRAAGRPVLTIAFLEVEPGVTTPENYGEIFGGRLPFDYVWFTPKANDRDYCAELKQRFRGKGKKRD
ncbi:MAG: ChaN family lipoprotein [Rhodospirillales bacterium]|nr:ChaN family lipoprotein [Rhodospirillales bacterium]